MRLGLALGYLIPGVTPADQLAVVQEAERLGYDSVWAAEAYGSDTATVLAWLAAGTSKIKLGAAIFQMPARSAAMTAMTAATIDQLSGGRMLLGLGTSGPQVAEGWHGQRFGHQLQRTREYVAVVRMALARERVEYHGETLELPLPDGPGKPLKLMISPVQDRIPIYLAAIGPKNTALTGEIADGWLPIFFSPEHVGEVRALLEEGAQRSGRSLEDFDIAPTVNTYISDDAAGARDRIRPFLALYIGGMGSRKQNFYNQLVQRYGFEDAAREVQDLYLEGKKDEAAAALPDELIDMVSLCGPRDAVRDRLAAFRDAGVGTLTISAMAWTTRGADRAAARGGRARGVSRFFLGAFGEPGHAFPMLALGARLAARGHEVTFETWSRWREDVEAAGMRFEPAPEYPLFSGSGGASEMYEAVVLATAETRHAVAELRPHVVVHDILTLAPALAAELEDVPVATLVPHLFPVGADGFPPYAVGARLPRTALGRGLWRGLERFTQAGLRQGRAELNATRVKVGLPPVTRLHGGLSERLCLVGTFPQLEYPRAWPAHVKVVGPIMWEPPFDSVKPPAGRGAARAGGAVDGPGSRAPAVARRAPRPRRRADPGAGHLEPPAPRRSGRGAGEHTAGRMALLREDDAFVRRCDLPCRARDDGARARPAAVPSSPRPTAETWPRTPRGWIGPAWASGCPGVS